MGLRGLCRFAECPGSVSEGSEGGRSRAGDDSVEKGVGSVVHSVSEGVELACRKNIL